MTIVTCRHRCSEVEGAEAALSLEDLAAQALEATTVALGEISGDEGETLEIILIMVSILILFVLN